MKWNSLYHIYEGMAILVIASCWWLLSFDSKPDYQAQFMVFNEVLETTLHNAKIKMAKEDNDLRRDVKKNGDSREGLERVRLITLLQKKTNTIIASLEASKDQLSQLAVDDHEAAIDLMIRQGHAYHIKGALDSMVVWMQSKFEYLEIPKLEMLAEGNAYNPLYYASEENKDFAHTYFSATSPIEAMTVISQKQTVLMRYQAEVMKKLGAGDVGCCCMKFDIIEPYVHAPLTQIQVGDEYTAQMHIAAPASKARPRMSINSTPIAVEDGTGEVAFRTQGVGKKYWEGKITFKNKGRDTTMVHRVYYTLLPQN